MTNATLDKARGHPRDDGHGQKIASEEPQPGYYGLVPLAFVGDAVTLPIQCIWVTVVWPLLSPDVRDRL